MSDFINSDLVKWIGLVAILCDLGAIPFAVWGWFRGYRIRKRLVTCARCDGRGRYSDFPTISTYPADTCEVCKGRGFLST